jgi:hypothetical protein
MQPTQTETKRVAVVGNTGSGKTTVGCFKLSSNISLLTRHLQFSRRLSIELGVPHLEIDSITWQSNWKRAADLKERIEGFLNSTEHWIVDGTRFSIIAFFSSNPNRKYRRGARSYMEQGHSRNMARLSSPCSFVEVRIENFEKVDIEGAPMEWK